MQAIDRLLQLDNPKLLYMIDRTKAPAKNDDTGLRLAAGEQQQAQRLLVAGTILASTAASLGFLGILAQEDQKFAQKKAEEPSLSQDAFRKSQKECRDSF